jgi:hypothetical protein
MSNYTITATVDKVREMLRQTSDDSVYTDPFIYSLLLDKRNLLIEREANKRKMRSLFNRKTICMPFIESNTIPCDCIPEELGCIALRSKYPVPRPVSTIFGDLIWLYTLDLSDDISFKQTFVGKYNKYSRQGSVPAYAVYYNEYVYIIGWPENKLEAAIIQIIPEDPVEMDQITLCDEEGNELDDTCFDPTLDTFNIDAHLHAFMIELVIKEITGSFNYQEDITNNSSSPIKAETI